jgi:hypothetical protein
VASPVRSHDFDVAGWVASDFLWFFLCWVILLRPGQVEDKVTVGRVEADHDFLLDTSTSDAAILVLSVDTNLTGLAHFARPGERGQEDTGRRDPASDLEVRRWITKAGERDS